MTLDRQQRLELLAADGQASDAERAELAGRGLDPDAWRRPSALLRDMLCDVDAPDLAASIMARISEADALLHARLRAQLHAVLVPAGAPDVSDAVLDALALHAPDLRDALGLALETPGVDVAATVLDALDLAEVDPGPLLRELLAVRQPDLSGDVMAALGVDDAVGTELRAALRAPEIDLADDVMAAIGGADADLSAPLRDALAAPDVDLADGIMAAIGGADADLSAPLRDALAAPDVDLADDIMATLGLAPAAAEDAASDDLLDDAESPTLAPVLPLQPPTPRTPATRPAVRRPRRARGLGFPAAGLAAAAALMLFFTGSTTTLDPDQLAFELAPINHVDIEELSAGDEVMVQVLQMDENAPTIIYIDELDPSGDDGGTAL